MFRYLQTERGREGEETKNGRLGMLADLNFGDKSFFKSFRGPDSEVEALGTEV